MTEAEARSWLDAHGVPRGTIERLEAFVTLLLAANLRQNLIGVSTIAQIWARHVVDSAQLLDHAPEDGHWIDIGTGAGFPGLIVALLRDRPTTLVESRALRAAFLVEACETLGLTHVAVLAMPVASVRVAPAAVLSARAVAPLDRLFAAAAHLANADTVWLLPKGRSAASELAAARGSWQGAFAMQPSVTDPAAAIVIARDVARRTRA